MKLDEILEAVALVGLVLFAGSFGWRWAVLGVSLLLLLVVAPAAAAASHRDEDDS